MLILAWVIHLYMETVLSISICYHDKLGDLGSDYIGLVFKQVMTNVSLEIYSYKVCIYNYAYMLLSLPRENKSGYHPTKNMLIHSSTTSYHITPSLMPEQ